ncbi:hypothetical protein RCL1_000984 [Eukaryota sp. TZLM3-RCL]
MVGSTDCKRVVETISTTLTSSSLNKIDCDNFTLLLRNKLIMEQKASFNELEMQNILEKVVHESPNRTTGLGWISVLFDLPPSVTMFAANASLDTLPTPDNLRRWKIERKMSSQRKIVSDKCLLGEEGLCTIGHVLSYCTFMLEHDVFNRPKWRHDTVLATSIKKVFHNLGVIEYYCDLHVRENHYVHLHFSSSNLRPDLVLIKGKQIHNCELSCPMEDYIDVRRSEKNSSFQSLFNESTTQGFAPSVYAFEVGARGVVSGETFDLLAALAINSGKSKQIADELTKVVLLCSYKINLTGDNKVRKILE